jgi:hypothetical protein
LNKLVKHLRLPIPFPDFLGSEDFVQLSRGVLETTTIPHSIHTNLAVSRPHDVFEQLPIPADLDFSPHFFPRPDQNPGHSTSAALGSGDQEFNMMTDTGYSRTPDYPFGCQGPCRPKI